MSYVDGFVAAVPTANKARYKEFVTLTSKLIQEFGATRVVECWEDDVPEGQVTDFKRAVKAEPTEAIVFSWVEYPSKDVRDAAMQKMMQDTRMKEFGDMPFDGKRMIFGGFQPMIDQQ